MSDFEDRFTPLFRIDLPPPLELRSSKKPRDKFWRKQLTSKSLKLSGMNTVKIRQKFLFREKPPEIDKSNDISSDFDSISITSDDAIPASRSTTDSPRGSILSSSSTYVFNPRTPKEEPLPMKLASSADFYMPKTPDSTVITLSNSKQSNSSSQMKTFGTDEIVGSPSSFLGAHKLSLLRDSLKSPKKSKKFLPNVEAINFYGMNNDHVAGINFPRAASNPYLKNDPKSTKHSKFETGTDNHHRLDTNSTDIKFLNLPNSVKIYETSSVEENMPKSNHNRNNSKVEPDKLKVTPVILRKKSNVDESLNYIRQSRLKLKRLNGVGDSFDRKIPVAMVRPTIPEKPTKFKNCEFNHPAAETNAFSVTTAPPITSPNVVDQNKINISENPTKNVHKDIKPKNPIIAKKPKIFKEMYSHAEIISKDLTPEVNNNYIINKSSHTLNETSFKPKFLPDESSSITQILSASAQKISRLSPSLKPRNVKDLVASFNVVSSSAARPQQANHNYLRHSVDHGVGLSKALEKSNKTFNASKVKRNSWTPPNTREHPKISPERNLNGILSKPCLSKRFSSEYSLNSSERSPSVPQIDLQSISDELNRRFLERVSPCNSTASSSSEDTKSSKSDDSYESSKTHPPHSVVNIIADNRLDDLSNIKRFGKPTGLKCKTRQFLYMDSNNRDMF